MKRGNGVQWLKRAGIICGAGMIAFSAWLLFILNSVPSVLEVGDPNPVGVLFDNVRLLSMVGERPESNGPQAVLIMGDRIIEIGAVGEISAPENVVVIDGQGYTLMPGLIDAHVHLNDELELAAYLAHGVTGLRNMSGYPFHLRLIERAGQGRILSPDLMSTGPILNSPGPNELVLQTTVITADEARLAVRNQYTAGYRHLKVYSNLSSEAFDSIVDESARLGMTVSGHSPEGERTAGIPRREPFEIPWESSLGRGFKTLEHIETIVWHGLRDDLDQAKMSLIATNLAESGEAVTPTLYAHKRLVLIAQTEGAYLERPGSDMINPLVSWFSKGDQQYWSQLDASAYEEPHADFFLVATGLLHQAGVPLLTGTDSGSFGIIPGASLARELELLVAAGLAPFEALRSATRLNAEILGFEETGMIVPGYRANLVLLPEDPLAEISIVEFPVGVMVSGHWMDQQALDAMKDAARNAGPSSFFRSLIRVIEMMLSR